ncbi:MULTISPECIES: class F sortase [unclassified Micromonospora]|uniref:class F sortase n=1 Tax=unclassified Micromonospora TaxID=2617518 RepID=UPI000EF49F6A|nr:MULTISPECIES: class F sortase [unclassified Micromonospora]RLP95032.1 class F sortase [Micromonospora sp. BL4]RLP99139.1 class F sortase [Micromonospora sp. CV4]
MTTTRAGGRHGKPWRAAGAVVVVTLAMIGAGMIGASLKTTPSPRPPQPLAQAGPEVTGPAVTGTDVPPVDGEPAADGDVPAGLARSAPTSIEIPKIGVNATIMSLGTNPDGTVQVPPLEQADQAGWYEPGASPGETGNAVIVGHVDSAKLGPAVFFDLGSLVPGDTITVRRADGKPVAFKVDSVKSYPKTSFPTELVYGPNDRPGLRVVTCGGQFDQAAKSYPDNVVVFATLAG